MTWYDLDRRGPGQLVIRPSDPAHRPAGGISQTVLRDVDFSAALEELREAEADSSAPEINWGMIGGRLALLSEAGITDPYLALLSVVYCASGRAKPMEFLSEITGKSPAAIKGHLWHASRRGFLVRSPGRRGGQFTTEALEMLEDAQEEQDRAERNARYALGYYYAQLKRAAYTEEQRKEFAELFADRYSREGLSQAEALKAYEADQELLDFA